MASRTELVYLIEKHWLIQYERVCIYAPVILIWLILLILSFVDCIDNIENVLHSCDFNHIIITGDFNTNFSRDNAQSKCLSEFLVRKQFIYVVGASISKKG